MKNLVIKSAMLIILVLFFGCSSDDSSESCTPIACKNGGVFLNCACDCPQGYTGSDCSQFITPSSIRIHKLTIIKFPAFNANGQLWDNDLIGNSQKADIYVKMANAEGMIINEDGNAFDNADPNTPYTYIVSPYKTINSVSLPIVLQLYNDNVSDADELMMQASFQLYTQNQSFDNIIEFSNTSGTFKFQFEVTYTW